jgi:hypothetical protein
MIPQGAHRPKRAPRPITLYLYHFFMPSGKFFTPYEWRLDDVDPNFVASLAPRRGSGNKESTLAKEEQYVRPGCDRLGTRGVSADLFPVLEKIQKTR